MPDIFEKRVNLKPYEYPELLEYKDAIRHSYWIHTEYNLTSDVQDFKINTTDIEKSVIRKTMLAISQIEVSFKSFWGKIHDRMPKPEIGAVGMTFAESEVRHADAYSHLLEILGLNDDFNSINEIPAIIDRINYLDKYLVGSKSRDNKKYALSVLLFSVFIEHVSLFSQFLIMISFNRHKNMFKGISNIVSATFQEEDSHGKFGLAIVNIIKEENPDWFDEEFKEEIKRACAKAERAETKILDWIFEEGDLEFMSKDVVKNFIRDRFNNSMESLEIDPLFEVDESMLLETQWFNEELNSTTEGDFFNKRSTNYTKKAKSITENDLF